MNWVCFSLRWGAKQKLLWLDLSHSANLEPHSAPGPFWQAGSQNISLKGCQALLFLLQGMVGLGSLGHPNAPKQT